MECKHCKSTNTIKYGYQKNSCQKYQCKNCQHYFQENYVFNHALLKTSK